MSKDSKKPAIRFKGFTDDWEQRKCGDVMKESRIPGHSGDVAKKITVKLWGKGVFKKDDIGSSNTQYFVRKEGQFIYSKLDFLNSAFGVIPKELDSYETTADLPAFDCVCVNPYFMFYRAIQPNFYYENGIIADGSRKAKRIHADVFLNMPLKLPSIEEQNKITKFLLQLENLITLHQRKLDKLKNIKKALLEKMFPRNGENIPEVRFKGFSDDWEQRKFGDVFNEYSEKKHPELPALTIIQGTGTILRDESDRKLQYDKASLVNYKLVNKDDLIVHLRSFEGGLEKANSEGIVSPAYHIFHGENTDTRFYYPFFRSRRFIDVLLKPHVYGIRDGKSIDIEGMKTISIPVPSYEEQEKVGDFIEKLDNLITLHQRKLDKLKNIKKALLEKMFV